MKTVTLDVRVPTEAMADFSNAWKSGKAQKSPRISFASPELLWRVLTVKRWQLLKALCGAGPVSIREAARRVNRDVKAVHGDVTAPSWQVCSTVSKAAASNFRTRRSRWSSCSRRRSGKQTSRIAHRLEPPALEALCNSNTAPLTEVVPRSLRAKRGNPVAEWAEHVMAMLTRTCPVGALPTRPPRATEPEQASGQFPLLCQDKETHRAKT